MTENSVVEPISLFEAVILYEIPIRTATQSRIPRKRMGENRKKNHARQKPGQGEQNKCADSREALNFLAMCKYQTMCISG